METSTLFQTLLALQPRVTTGSGRNRDAVVEETAQNFLQRLPSEIRYEVSRFYGAHIYLFSNNDLFVNRLARNLLLIRCPQF